MGRIYHKTIAQNRSKALVDVWIEQARQSVEICKALCRFTDQLGSQLRRAQYAVNRGSHSRTPPALGIHSTYPSQGLFALAREALTKARVRRKSLRKRLRAEFALTVCPLRTSRQSWCFIAGGRSVLRDGHHTFAGNCSLKGCRRGLSVQPVEVKSDRTKRW